MSQPIRPDQVGALKAQLFPAYVFDGFNELIAQNFVGKSATIKQQDVIENILAKANAGLSSDEIDGGAGLTLAELYKRGYLNVEEAYRAQGWKVEYDKPAYNESYPATFTFKAP